MRLQVPRNVNGAGALPSDVLVSLGVHEVYKPEVDSSPTQSTRAGYSG